ncbi:MAG: hypothetical protein JNL05_12150, partial [Flavobacteriales bacterium]|nr:hypothetical protein [Flavobacteriales bacterium]
MNRNMYPNTTWHLPLLRALLCALVMLGAAPNFLSAQTITTGSTAPYNGGNGVSGNGVVTFGVTNSSGSDVLLTSIESYWQTASNGANTTLWATTVPASMGGVYFPFVTANWTVVGTGTNLAVPADGIHPTISGMTYLIPNGASVRFLLESNLNIRYSGTGAITPNSFTVGGITLQCGDVVLPGATGNVGYGGLFSNTGNTPRYFTGTLNFTPATPCAGLPTAGTISGAPFVCTGGSTTLSLTGSTVGTGLTRNWFSSTTPGGPYTTPAGSGISISTGPVSVTTYYVCTVTCTNSGLSATTPEFTLPVQTAGAGGTFTINNTLPTGGTNFASFTDAINYLNLLSVCGPFTGTYTLNVSAGQTFTENPPTLTASGSAGNPIVFQKSGAGANPVIVASGSAGATDAGFAIRGGNYITVDGVDIDGGNGCEFGYYIANASATVSSNFNTIQNCTIRLDRTNTNSRGIMCTSSTTGGGFTPTAASGSNSNNAFYNFTIEDCYAGIFVTSGSSTWPGIGNIVGTLPGGTSTVGASYAGTPLPDIGGSTTATWGIQFNAQQNGQIFNCTVRNVGSTGINRGIYSLGGLGTTLIYGNKVYGVRNTSTTSTSTQRGIETTMNTTGTHSTRIYNNFVSDITAAYTGAATATRIVTGIHATSGGATTTSEVDHNNVSLDNIGAATYSTICLDFASATGVNRSRGNSLANFTGAQTGVAVHFVIRSTGATALGASGSESNYNNLHLANTTNGFVGQTSTTNRATKADWTAALTGTPNTDLNSITGDPLYVNNNTDLHVTGALNNAAGPPAGLAWITVDIDGDARSTPADIGADEYVFTGGDVIPPSITSFVVTDLCNLTGATLTATIADGGGVNNVAGTRPRLYYYKNAGSFNGTTFVEGTLTSGTVNSGTWTFVFNAGLVGGLVPGDVLSYFVIAQDAVPNVGASPNAGLVATSVSAITTYPTNPVTYTVASILSGTYAIPGAYSTLTAAVAAYNTSCLGGNVVFELAAGYTSTGETFPIVINSNADASATKTLTIRPAAGSTPTITGVVSPGAVIKLNGADWVTIDGSNSGGTDRSLTISNTTTSTATTSAVVWLSAPAAGNGATNNVVKNCVIEGNSPTTTYLGVFVGGDATIGLTQAGLANNNANTITNNLFRKTQYGAAFFGFVAGTPDQNNAVTNNTFGTAVAGEGFALAGLNADRQENMVVAGNEVQNVTNATTASNMFGLRLLDFKNGQCYNNNIHDLTYTGTSTPKLYGIAVTSSTYTTVGNPSNGLFYNNFVSRITSTGTSAVWNSTGILAGAGYGDRFYHNSVSLTGQLANSTSGLVACFANGDGNITAAGTNIDVRNNIFSLTGTNGNAGGNWWAFYSRATSLAGSTVNYNVLHCAGTGATNNVGFLNSTSYATLPTWQAASTQDANSVVTAPVFNSTTDLHLIPGSNVLLNNLGTPIAAVTTDIDGDVRSGTTPDMGADEFSVPLQDAGITAIVLPPSLCGGSAVVSATVTNFGLTPLTSVLIDWSVDGVPQPQANPGAINIATGASQTFALGSYTFVVGQVYSITAATTAPNGGVDGNTSNDAFTAPGITTGLTGTYTVGAGGDFTTLTAAANAFNSTSLCGPVVFSLLDATYPGETFPITFNANTGSSSTNTLTIRPATGVTTTITGGLASGALIKLNGADWVTIDGSNSGGTDRSLTINNTATTAAAGIWISSLGNGAGATNNTVKNCVITATGSATGSYGIAVSGATIASAGGDNDNTTLQNNAISSRNTGIYANGNAAVSAGGMDNLVVAGNEFTSSGTSAPTYGVQVANALGASIDANTFNLSTTAATAPVAMSLEANVSNTSVTRNRVESLFSSNTGGYGGRGIAVGTGTTNANITIANNFIAGVNGSNWTSFGNSSAMGIALGMVGNSTTITTVTGGISIHHNTVNLEGNYLGTSTTANKITAAIYVGSGASNLDIRNNLFSNSLVNTLATAKAYAIYSAAANTAFTNINYNNYYTGGSQAVLGFLGADQTTFGALQTALGGNTSSSNIAPVFTSATDLHLVPASNPGLDNTGTPIAGITLDIDGDLRSLGTPDMGADEFTGPDCSIATGGTITPATALVCGSATYTMTAVGATAGTGIVYQWEVSSVGGGVGFAPVTGGTGANSPSYTTGVLAPGQYYFRLKVDCTPAFLTDYSNELALEVDNPPLTPTVYTIDNTLPTGGSNFASFTEAINFVNGYTACGLSAAITFNVTAGQTFTEDPPAITVSGTALSRLTFQRSGTGANPVVVPAGTAGTADFGLGISGGDFITFDGIDVNSPGPSSVVEHGYLVRNASATNGAQGVIIKNCAVALNRSFSITMGVVSTNSTTVGGGFTPSSASGANSDLLLDNITVTSCLNMGIRVEGNASFPVLNNVIQNCTVGAPYTGIVLPDIGSSTATTAPSGIYATNVQDIKVRFNTVRNIGGFSATPKGIWVNAAVGTANEVNNNQVQGVRTMNNSASLARGMEANCSATGTNALYIWNNTVSDISTAYTTASTTRYISGLFVGGASASSTYYVDHNTIAVDGSASPNVSSACFEVGGVTATHLVRNNIFANLTANQTGTPFHVAVFSPTAASLGSATSEWNYNDLYVPNTGRGFAGALTTTNLYATIAALNTAVTTPANNDQNSVSVDPSFYGVPGDLHVYGSGVNGTGGSTTTVPPIAAMPWASTDIDGQTRQDPPDMGADEFTPPTCLPPTGISITALSSSTATFTWTNNGALSYDWEVRTSGAAGSGPAGLVASGNTASGPVSVTGLAGSAGHVAYVRSNCAGAQVSPWTSVLFITPAGCDQVFTDDGGAGNYTNNQNTITTICPGNTATERVAVQFTSFTTNVADPLYVYDGTSTADPLITGPLGVQGSFPAGGWGGSGLANAPQNTGIQGLVLATNPSGCLTFQHRSDAATVAAGWAANVICQPTNFTCATAQPIGCFDIQLGSTQGSTNTLPTSACAFNGAPSSGGVNWWVYTATTNDDVRFKVSNPGFDVRLSAFRPVPDCNNLVCIGAVDNTAGFGQGGELKVACAPGDVIYLAVHGIGSGVYSLETDCTAPCAVPAPNDLCSGATNMPLAGFVPVTVVDDNTCAYVDGPTLTSGTSPVQGLWYTFSSGVNSIVRMYLGTPGSATGLRYALFDGTCNGLSALSEVANGIAPPTYYVNLPVTPGNTYKLLVYNGGGVGVEGTYTLGLEAPPLDDAAITAILSPLPTVCGTQLQPVVKLANLGENTLTGVVIN